MAPLYAKVICEACIEGKAMKAVLMTAPGSPEVLQMREIANPLPPQNTQLLVRLKAAGISPIDTKLRKRGTFIPIKCLQY